MTNLWEVIERSSAQKKEEERGEQARDAIASSFCYRPCRASHFMGPHLVCSPHPIKKGWPTYLGRGEGLTAVVLCRRGRKERKVEAVVVGDKRARSSAQFVSH